MDGDRGFIVRWRRTRSRGTHVWKLGMESWRREFLRWKEWLRGGEGRSVFILQLLHTSMLLFTEKDGVFGIVDWVQEGGGIMGGREGRDCCSIEVIQ